MITWMVYSALIALIVAAAARAAESLARLRGYRVRWIWAAALALTAILSGSAAARRAEPALSSPIASSSIALGAGARASTNTSLPAVFLAQINRVRHALAAPLERGFVSVDRAVSPAMSAYASMLAVAISVFIGLVFAAVGRRFRQARKDWPVVTIHGVDVRVAPRVGPLVIGVVRPEIVVPRWLLGRNASDQRLVVAHENEHVRARDPLLLGVALVAGIIAPWSPAVWYMLSRLRLAIELDCDARVLRRGAAPRSYGSLLIDVAQHASGLRLSALALADDSSHLHQRILAMKWRAPRFARVRGGTAAAFSLVAVLVACQASLPATHGVGAPARSIQGAVVTQTASATDAPAAGQLDGVKTPRELGASTYRKRRSAAAMFAADSSSERRGAPVEALAENADSANALTLIGTRARAPFTGVILIDGVRSTMGQLRSLDRDQIEAIEIVKGPAAALAYKDPEAANGVIAVKTKIDNTPH